MRHHQNSPTANMHAILEHIFVLHANRLREKYPGKKIRNAEVFASAIPVFERFGYIELGKIAEAARGISCPANYGRKESEQDRGRLQTIFAKRRSGASGGKIPTETEIAEEAQLAARVAAFDQGPEPRARGRILALAIADFSRGLSDGETEELERLQMAYPPDPVTNPLIDAIEAYRRGELDWQDRRSKVGSES
jgi:hypothetical protein